ncbi:MAG TPA: pentapeptide repeat-containing protein [Archangium sp.]|uniref:pentapeptide repeat-containing protein n=1 Tax=Archangium sp. TaxID=1872627 RepID=UPI002E303537|nr:pentapeptide repeat-containing protein [Archangium sp.]HEX5750277.1 pentapeptide repeat-containing protein [Archangium sp.]
MKSRWMAPGALASVLLLAGASGCAPDAALSEESLSLETEARPVLTVNGIEFNGIELNGIELNGTNLNGTNLNGTNLNGLDTSGLNTPDFRAWFNQDVTRHDMLMKYMVQCAVPAGESRTFTNPETNTPYTWSGVLGLAPDWASGQPVTTAELRIVSACLAAHVNPYGQHVSISVLGLDATGQPTPYTAEELQSHALREGCFFGNLFQSEPVLFVGNDGLSLSSVQSSSRACALGSTLPGCAPLVYVGRCEDLCTREASSPFYTSCTWNGVTYPAITTRVRQEDLYSCGDGVCQVTEHCGSGMTAGSCRLDCGSC